MVGLTRGPCVRRMAGQCGGRYSCSLMGHQGTNLTGASFVSRELIADNGPDPVAVLTDASFFQALGKLDMESFRTDIIS